MKKHKLKECGFEGCFYDNGVDGNKAVILTIVYSGDSFFCKNLAKWLNKNNIAVIGLTTFGVEGMHHGQDEIVKKCAVREYPKSWIGRSQAA